MVTVLKVRQHPDQVRVKSRIRLQAVEQGEQLDLDLRLAMEGRLILDDLDGDLAASGRMLRIV